jgi:hypothetical protein
VIGVEHERVLVGHLLRGAVEAVDRRLVVIPLTHVLVARN